VSTRRRSPGPAGVALLVLGGVVAIAGCVCLSAVVIELRKDPLQRAGEESIRQTARKLSRELDQRPVDDPPGGHVEMIVAAVEGRDERYQRLPPDGHVYLVEVDGDHGRVQAIFTKYVQSGGGLFSRSGEVTVCVRWDVRRVSAVYSDVTARTVSCRGRIHRPA
jgi:hypothetical protein